MGFTNEQLLQKGVLQAEMYRLQKLIARREFQDDYVIDMTTVPPVLPDGEFPTVREDFKPAHLMNIPDDDYLHQLINHYGIKTGISNDAGELMEFCSCNTDEWLRQNYNGINEIGVLTSGGDAPGMNAAIRSVTMTALNYGFTGKGKIWNPAIYGIKDGYIGLMDWLLKREMPEKLTRDRVCDIAGEAGSILRSMRYPKFKDELNANAGKINKNSKQGLIVIGGDGTARGARELWQTIRMPVVALPGTIDNDTHPWSDRSIGFASALSMADIMLNAVRSTGAATARLFLVQLMGRKRGDLPIFASIAGNCRLVLTAERSREPWNYYKILRLLKLIYKEIETNPFGSAVVAVAEGVEFPKNLKDWKKPPIECLKTALTHLHKKLGKKYKPKSKTRKLWNSLAPQRKSIKLDIRVMDLGHAQRGGMPVPEDIILASRLGCHAVETLCTMDWDWAEKAHPDEIPFIGIRNDRPTMTWVNPG